jgi:serine/threonine-protein kinase
MNAPHREEVSGTLVLGRYRIVQQLARGGMGVVYLARTEGAQGFTRPVIVKRIIPDLAADEATARSFVREARILANLQHPGIVNVIDFDREPSGAYVMVLEYVHGYNLGQWHKFVVDTRKQLPVDYAIYIMVRVLDALHYAHTFVRPDGVPMQIVHRDVSPGNILVDTQGHVKLLDFGIARADQTEEYKTRDGMFKGKLTYAAPEVYDGSTSSPKSDVYSAAVVLYQLLAGENPFKGKNMSEIVRRVLTEKLPPISVKREDITPELDAALTMALSKSPDDRFPTAAAFADALRLARPRREEEFVTDFIDDVWNDYNGTMPEVLGLEPLNKRDAAWRAASGADESRGMLASTPPPARPNSEAPTQTQPPTVAPPALRGLRPPTETEAEAAAPPPSRSGPRYTVWLSAGAAVLAGAAALFAWSAKKPEPGPSQFVVVEKQAREEVAENAASAVPTDTAPPAAPPSAAPVVSASAAAPAVSASPPVVPASATKSAAPTKPDGALLSKAVQRQRGQIEACFLQHVKEVDGRPEVSIRFRVNADGNVEAADLNPSTLNGTPLGQCLIGVAKRTSFGPQSEGISFTIPITARRVTK